MVFFMRLHRFYIQAPISSKIFDISDKELVHQWRSVFRYNVGSQVVLFDGSGTDHLCMITSLRNLGASLEVVEKAKSHFVPNREVWLCAAIIKKDNFEMIVQKATELGVTHIVPVLCERTEKKNISLERLQKIAVEASEQSGRGDVPQIHPVVALVDTFQSADLPKDKIALHPEGELLADFLTHTNPKKLAVFLGPEGGFSENEIKEFASAGIPTVSIGTQILRAETAAVAVASLLLL
jgi:16S rRNA (uracil1498-N3)-methyltransferase